MTFQQKIIFYHTLATNLKLYTVVDYILYSPEELLVYVTHCMIVNYIIIKNLISLSHSDNGSEYNETNVVNCGSFSSIILILNEAHFRTSINLFLNVLQSIIIINVTFVTIICAV